MRPWASASRGIVAILVLFLAACTAPPSDPAVLAADSTPSAPSAPASDNSTYVIGPGDSLSIFVYRSPELSVDLPVRPDGLFSMPLVSDIQAAGRTPSQLGKDLEARLAQFIRDPTVTVMVRSFVGPTNRLVRVIGEATEPQAIAYRDGMTLLDVMIATKGLTRFAAGNRAEVIRRDTPTSAPRAIPVRLSDLLRNGDISQDIAMRPGDTLLIPQSWF